MISYRNIFNMASYLLICMLVQIVMGSKSDMKVAKRVINQLKEFEIPYELAIVSAHRSPELVEQIARKEVDLFIAIAGKAAALPGALASRTLKPVIGVPVSGKVNLDAILSIVQLPRGTPVAAIGLDQGENAALLAAQILAMKNKKIEEKLKQYRKDLRREIIESNKEVRNV
jgi:5-(carboxyamino)imidazole ribonucleotide mutase